MERSEARAEQRSLAQRRHTAQNSAVLAYVLNLLRCDPEPPHQFARAFDAARHTSNFQPYMLSPDWVQLPYKTSAAGLTTFMNSTHPQQQRQIAHTDQLPSRTIHREVHWPNVSATTAPDYSPKRNDAYELARRQNTSSPMDVAIAANTVTPSPVPGQISFLNGYAIKKDELLFPPDTPDNAEFAVPANIPQSCRHMKLNWTMRGGSIWLSRSQRKQYWTAHLEMQKYSTSTSSTSSSNMMRNHR